jgi:bifunctional UDP-N-acetylglucosamine pyrophosphorylase / glucosamine-1-phosphate N-acetyltransferase
MKPEEMPIMFEPKNFFDYSDWEYRELFDEVDQVWEILPRIKPFLQANVRSNLGALVSGGLFINCMTVLHQGKVLEKGFTFFPGDATKGQCRVVYDNQTLEGAVVIYGGVTLVGNDIFIGSGSVVESGAFIQGPAFIGRQTEVRQGAYLRGGCLVGDRCVVGHVTEMKNSIMFSGAKAGHFAYIGDSLIGKECNLGAGTKLANLKLIKTTIKIKGGDKVYDTGLKKFGVIMGDGTETGCNSVTSPGTLLGPQCLVAPNATVKAGYHPRQTIIR